MLRRWIVDSGVSRGMRTSLRSSLSATDAARWMRLSIAPEAIVPSVPIEHGQITYASTFAEPLAYGDFQSFGSYTVTLPPRACSSSRVSVSSRDSRGFAYSSVASTSIPADEAEMPSSTSAPLSASTSRAAYGAPEAPVMPRKTRTALLRALGRVEEDRERLQLRDAEVLPLGVLGRDVGESGELRHHVVAELGRVRDVRRQPLDPLPLRAFRTQVGRAEVTAARAEICVARSTAGFREHRRAGHRLRVVREALALRPRRNCGDDLARKGFLRDRALVGQLAHRDDDEDCRDHGHRTA